jgi:hypothetical protein
MLTAPESLQNLDALSRRTMNDWRTLAHICAVPVPHETNKEQIADLAARSEQTKQPLTDPNAAHPLNRTAPTTRQRP